jgi:glycerophosphoryl diester phosphodiesterase
MAALVGISAVLLAAPAAAGGRDSGHHHFKKKPAPIVIGHRGASGYRPEHTLESYSLAIKQGADFIEPDLVATKDKRLIARHENVLAIVQLDAGGAILLDANGKPTVLQETTNVADKPEFADRLTVKTIDTLSVGGWFSEDFTLAEIKTMRARERIPGTRPDNAAFNDQFEIPTLEEVIDLVKSVERKAGKKIGIYPETKHPTFFALEGKLLDGVTPIDISLGQLLIDVLKQKRFTDPKRVFIQSFEVANLIELQNTIMPAAKVDLPLVQLLGDFVGSADPFSYPYDLRYNAAQGADLAAIYGGLAALVSIDADVSYGDLVTEEVIDHIAKTYAEGLGPWKDTILPRVALTPPLDGNGDGNAQITTILTGEIAPFLQIALDKGLDVHPYTLRAEEGFLTANPDGTAQNVVEEGIQLYEAGVTGFFIDQPVCGDIARDIFVKLQSYKDPRLAHSHRLRLLRSIRNPECFTKLGAAQASN